MGGGLFERRFIVAGEFPESDSFRDRQMVSAHDKTAITAVPSDYGTFEEGKRASAKGKEELSNASSWGKAGRLVLGMLALCGLSLLVYTFGSHRSLSGHSLIQTNGEVNALSMAINRWTHSLNDASSATTASASQEPESSKQVVASLYVVDAKYDIATRSLVSSSLASSKSGLVLVPKIVYGVRDEEAAAHGVFEDTLHEVGWSKLWLRGTARGNEASQSFLERSLTSTYAAGYLEGILTHHRIRQHFANTYYSFFPEGKAPIEIEAFARANLQFIQENVAKHATSSVSGASVDDEESRYWRSVGGVMAQFDGLVAGYQASAPKEAYLSAIDLFLLNLDGDLEDLIPALAEQNRTRKASLEAFQLRTRRHAVNASDIPYHEYIKGFRCSALVRITPDLQDVVWGHTTWDQFSAMVRILKSYDMPLTGLRSDEKTHRTISFSSSPGYLASVDDFYLSDSGLAVTETTNGVYKESLYELVSPATVPSWMRANVASYLSQSGAEWAKNFGRRNSGTYNNQWMVVDTNRFIPGEGFSAGGFTVLEQIPGRVVSKDMTDLINERGYWASYNIPYFEEIYRESGFQAMYEASNFSDEWSYERAPRAKIFKRDAPTVSSYADMKHMIRYNQWEEDPLSNGHPGNAIASRFDLEHPGRSLFGGVDAKVTSLLRARSMSLEAVNGPTTQQPVFRWSEQDAAAQAVLHEGHPEVFNFTFVSMHPLP